MVSLLPQHPTTADPAQQVRAVEDLIAKKVSVIAVVPNDAKALEPVFDRAKTAGIPIITHESPDQKGNVWDIEMIDNKEFGEQHMKDLAKYMGEEGEYIVFVGGLTVPLHNAWADAAIAYQKEHYPKMKLVADRYGVAESVDDSYRTTSDAILAHPNLKGILTFGSQGPIGAGRAIKEKGKADKIMLVGACSPSQGKKLVKEGIIKVGYIWSPIEAGAAIVTVAKMVLDKTPIVDGMDIPGLGKASVDPEKRVIRVIKDTDPSGNILFKDIGLLLKRHIEKYFKERSLEVRFKYIDPSYMIRGVPANPHDSIYCAHLAQNAVHAAMAGKTGVAIACWHGHYVHVPIGLAVAGRKQVDPKGDLWHSLIEATGQSPKFN
jgi:simple sugar transport system substrate-binding protein